MLEQLAVGKSHDHRLFYYVDKSIEKSIPDCPPWYDQVGSFDREQVISHCRGMFAPFVRGMEVNVERLLDLIARNGIDEIHLLHIDTEGSDYEVLMSLDFNKPRPRLVFVEHQHLLPDEKRGLKDLLEKNQYFVRDCGKDYAAFDRSVLKSYWKTLQRSENAG